MTDTRTLLRRTAELAADFLDSLEDRPVFPQATPDDLRASLHVPLQQEPLEPERVVEELAAAADPGLVAIPSGRYFGFVIGGGVPAALAADMLTSAWDQNAGLYAGGPSASIVEQVVREWVCDLLGLPDDASIGFVTGTQMGSVTALAAARYRVLERAGWDAGRDGLAGGPRVRVLVGEKRHVTIDRALRLLGIGTAQLDVLRLLARGDVADFVKGNKKALTTDVPYNATVELSRVEAADGWNAPTLAPAGNCHFTSAGTPASPGFCQ